MKPPWELKLRYQAPLIFLYANSDYARREKSKIGGRCREGTMMYAGAAVSLVRTQSTAVCHAQCPLQGPYAVQELMAGGVKKTDYFIFPADARLVQSEEFF